MKEYVVRKAFPRPEWHKGASHAKMWRNSVLGRVDSKCKGPEARMNAACLRPRKVSVAQTQ